MFPTGTNTLSWPRKGKVIPTYGEGKSLKEEWLLRSGAINASSVSLQRRDSAICRFCGPWSGDPSRGEDMIKEAARSTSEGAQGFFRALRDGVDRRGHLLSPMWIIGVRRSPRRHRSYPMITVSSPRVGKRTWRSDLPDRGVKPLEIEAETSPRGRSESA